MRAVALAARGAARARLRRRRRRAARPADGPVGVGARAALRRLAPERADPGAARARSCSRSTGSRARTTASTSASRSTAATACSCSRPISARWSWRAWSCSRCGSRELPAIALLREESAYETFLDATAAATQRAADALAAVLGDPVGTVAGLPAGVARLLRRTLRTVRQAALDVGDRLRERRQPSGAERPARRGMRSA
ncbi:MAG: hypothetical protein RML12_00170 [Xanthomonadales bacterium]|nr:hypothetical protein [Xanthomonadales bacterium]